MRAGTAYLAALLGAVQSPHGSLVGGVKPSAAGHQRPLTAKTPHRIAVARPSKGERRHATGAAGLTDSGRIRHPCHQGGLGGIPRHFRSIVGVAAADHLLPGRGVGGKLHPVEAFVANGRATVDLRGGCRWSRSGGHRRRDGRGWRGCRRSRCWAGGVGALLDELMVVLDCGCCHGRHSSPITTSNSNTAATETPISLRVTEPTESLWPVAPTVLEGPGVTWGLRAAGAGVVGAATTRMACGATVSVKARAKSVQHANRSSGFLANAAASTGSSEASSGRRSARAGTGALRWRLMMTAGLE